jgi:hypothetical protein
MRKDTHVITASRYGAEHWRTTDARLNLELTQVQHWGGQKALFFAASPYLPTHVFPKLL